MTFDVVAHDSQSDAVQPAASREFQQTQVGVIPTDWTVEELGKSAFVTKLAGFEYTKYFNYLLSGPIIAVRGLNVKNGALDLTDTHTIPRATSDLLPRSKLAKGDLVISYVGTLGRVAEIPEDNRFHLAPNVAKISVDRGVFAPSYLSQYLNSFQGQKAILDASASTTQAALSMGNLRRIFVVRPPLPEQESIAEALADVDALLAALDNLIAKKRAIKQAAMQQLLTGKTRLPGFTAEWGTKRLDSISAIISGGTPSTHQPEFWGGDVQWCTPTDITALNGGKYLTKTSRTLTERGLQASSAKLVPPGSVIMTSRATIGECAINLVPVATNQGFKNFVPNHETCAEFLYYLLQTKTNDFINLCGGSTFLEIGKSQLAVFEVELPTSQSEQQTIAAILSDMDTEITAIKQRRDKTQQIKQGMMQQLLTGRIRLVTLEAQL